MMMTDQERALRLAASTGFIALKVTIATAIGTRIYRKIRVGNFISDMSK